MTSYGGWWQSGYATKGDFQTLLPGLVGPTIGFGIGHCSDGTPILTEELRRF